MTISIVNHKGGTGKTTTTVNLGSALAVLGKKVLLIDFDAQGSLSYSLGIDEDLPTIADALHEDHPVEQLLIEREGMHILPAGKDLADVELAIAKSGGYFHHLQRVLDRLPGYDYILIDCPPSLSLLTLNALTASRFVIIPMQMDVLALRGLDSMLETIKKTTHLNPDLRVLGVLPVMIDPRKNIYQEIRAHIKNNYETHVFDPGIRTSVKAAEAPSFGKSAVGYSPSSSTAGDYKDLAGEMIRRIQSMQQSAIINN